MLGIPRHDQPQFVEWSDEMVAGAFAPLTPHGMRLSARSGSATAAMRRSLDPLIAQRRRNPGDDLISMMTPADADDVLTDDEIFWSAAMLIGAGSETTTNLLSGLLLTLAQQPDMYARLREHPELIPAAIEEQLRMVAPRCKGSTAPRPVITPSGRTRFRPARGCCCCSPRPTATRATTTIRTPSTSTAIRPTTSLSVAGSTIAWAYR